jgi:hypothetical protein
MDRSGLLSGVWWLAQESQLTERNWIQKSKICMKSMFVTRQLAKSQEFRQNYLGDFHLHIHENVDSKR